MSVGRIVEFGKKPQVKRVKQEKKNGIKEERKRVKIGERTG